MFEFTAVLLKEASQRDLIVRLQSAHWRRDKKGGLIEVKAGPSTPPKIISQHNGNRKELGTEAMEKYLTTGLDVLAATYVPQLTDWIDFIHGDHKIGLAHIQTKRDQLHAAWSQEFPDEENPFKSGIETLRMIPLVLANCTQIKDTGGKKVAEWGGWTVVLEATVPRCVISAFPATPAQYQRLIRVRPDLA